LASASTKRIRAWAVDAGYQIMPKGKIPNEVHDAYAAAHPDEQPPAGDELQGDELDLGLEDLELARDPDPKHDGKDTRRRAPRVNLPQRRDIKAKLSLLLMPPAVMFRRADPYCGAELYDQIPEIADALTDIVCDSADLVEFFTASAGYMKWLKLASALAPVGQVAWGHHFTHSIGQEQGDGPAAGGDMPPAGDRYHAPAL
jgi:hypothetical protein